MQHLAWKPLILSMAAFALCATAPSTLLAQDRQDDHHDQKPAEHRDDHRDDNRADPAAQYRHDHPRAAARCHDGFFTNTHDRGRACSKHGGIDVWLAP